MLALKNKNLIFRGCVHTNIVFTYNQLINYNVHLGGLVKDVLGTSYWFLFAKKEDFVFLNLLPTLLILRRVLRIVENVVYERRKIMFVNNDLSMASVVYNVAKECAEPYSVSIWVGGTLTNFKLLWIFYNQFLRAFSWRELSHPQARLKFSLQGLASLMGPPGLVFINSLRCSSQAAAEAHAIFTPVVGLIDVDSDSGDALYMIPANDDSVLSINFFNSIFARLILNCKYKMVKKLLQRKLVWEKRGAKFYNAHILKNLWNFRAQLEAVISKGVRLPKENWNLLSQLRRATNGLVMPGVVDSYLFRYQKNWLWKNKEFCGQPDYFNQNLFTEFGRKFKRELYEFFYWKDSRFWLKDRYHWLFSKKDVAWFSLAKFYIEKEKIFWKRVYVWPKQFSNSWVSTYRWDSNVAERFKNFLFFNSHVRHGVGKKRLIGFKMAFYFFKQLLKQYAGKNEFSKDFHQRKVLYSFFLCVEVFGTQTFAHNILHEGKISSKFLSIWKSTFQSLNFLKSNSKILDVMDSKTVGVKREFLEEFNNKKVNVIRNHRKLNSRFSSNSFDKFNLPISYSKFRTETLDNWNSNFLGKKASFSYTSLNLLRLMQVKSNNFFYEYGKFQSKSSFFSGVFSFWLNYKIKPYLLKNFIFLKDMILAGGHLSSKNNIFAYYFNSLNGHNEALARVDAKFKALLKRQKSRFVLNKILFTLVRNRACKKSRFKLSPVRRYKNKINSCLSRIKPLSIQLNNVAVNVFTRHESFNTFYLVFNKKGVERFYLSTLDNLGKPFFFHKPGQVLKTCVVEKFIGLNCLTYNLDDLSFMLDRAVNYYEVKKVFNMSNVFRELIQDENIRKIKIFWNFMKSKNIKLDGSRSITPREFRIIVNYIKKSQVNLDLLMGTVRNKVEALKRRQLFRSSGSGKYSKYNKFNNKFRKDFRVSGELRYNRNKRQDYSDKFTERSVKRGGSDKSHDIPKKGVLSEVKGVPVKRHLKNSNISINFIYK